jgi:hypothetical protein
MSIKAMASIVAAVAFTVIAARNAEPSAAMGSPWLRHAVQVNDALPPWHPPIEAGRLPPGHPPVGPRDPRLPEGHPPIPWMEPDCPAGAAPTSPDGIEREGDFLREEPPVIST